MHIHESHFKDEHGRALMLRGVNLGGSSKVPYQPDGATYIRAGFFEHRNVSFVNRPFPLAEADEHFTRLKSWGFNFLRFLVTWEAIEHAGPGRYDLEYLDYLRAVVERAAEHGIRLFIDPHQDVWSRFSGGDGAPGWTFESVGMDMRHFQETGAAFVHQLHGDPLPQMIWSSNATKLAAATMFTLFFGGNDFAPRAHIEGEPAQEFLQRHYINSIVQVAKTLKGLPNVIGFDSMNEPAEGYIGMSDLNKRYTLINKGVIPTPFESMQLGAGVPLELHSWEEGIFGPIPVGKGVVNPNRLLAWENADRDVWRAEGVWDFDSQGKPRLLKPNHFSQVDGRTVDFNRDYYVPFNNRFAKAIRAVQPEALIFVEKGFRNPGPDWGSNDAPNIVYAPHWYDPITLALKFYTAWVNVDQARRRLIFGPWAIKRSFAGQLRKPKEHASQRMGNVPTLLGETGISYDLNHKRAFRTGDFSAQVKAYDRIFQAVEANLLNVTLWNYTADNTNERGDLWNDEDLSIFSRDQQTNPDDVNSGGRALQAVVRPYPLAAAGEPLRLSFDIRRKIFTFTFRHDSNITEPTLIFVPTYQYPAGCQVKVSDGKFEWIREEQIVKYWHTSEQSEHAIHIRSR
ncbi:MAG: cellulase family glycosylhydrolase [Chloroflexota bacterium]